MAALPAVGSKMSEKDMEAYADFLDELKESDPAKYMEVMTSLSAQMGQVAGAGAEEPKVSEELKLPGKGGKVLKKGEVQEKDPGLKITPEPGFVIKTLDGEGVKVFINVCSNKAIGAPGLKKKLMDDGTEQEGTNFPVSIGPAKPETDKSGKECVVYDCIFNPKVVREASADETGGSRQLLCDVCATYLEQKYKVALDRRFKFPKLQYKGTVATPQWIRSRKAPVIEEVGSTAGADSGGLAGLAQGGSGAMKKTKKKKRPVEDKEFATYRLVKVYGEREGGEARDGPREVTCAMDGSEVDSLIRGDSNVAGHVPLRLRLEVEVPKIGSVILPSMGATEGPATPPVELEVSAWLLCLRLRGYHDLEVFLPYPVSPCGNTQSDSSGDRAVEGASAETKALADGDGGGEEKAAWSARGGGGEDDEDDGEEKGGPGPGPAKGSRRDVAGGTVPSCVFDPALRVVTVWLDVDRDAALCASEPPLLTENTGPDAGSRAWLLSEALKDTMRPPPATTAGAGAGSDTTGGSRGAQEQDQGDDLLESSDDELPEDRFHAKDLMSRHYLQQKEEGKRNTRETSRKREARAKEEAEEAAAAAAAAKARDGGGREPAAGAKGAAAAAGDTGADPGGAAAATPAPTPAPAPPTNKSSEQLVFELD